MMLLREQLANEACNEHIVRLPHVQDEIDDPLKSSQGI